MLAAIADQPVLRRRRGRSTARCRRRKCSAARRRPASRRDAASCSSALRQQRIAGAEADLRQARAGAHHDRKGARADLEIERTGIAGGDLVELLAAIGHDAGEDVEPAGRALRIGRGRDVRRQRQAFEQRHDVDAAGLQHRAVGEIDLVQLQPVELFGDRVVGPGQEAGAHAPGLRRRASDRGWPAGSGRHRAAAATSARRTGTAPRCPDREECLSAASCAQPAPSVETGTRLVQAS